MPELPNLQKQMLDDANIILASIDFTENLINKKMRLFDNAQAIGDKDAIEIIKKDILKLLKKLKLEEKQMDAYMIKYKKLVENAKLNQK